MYALGRTPPRKKSIPSDNPNLGGEVVTDAPSSGNFTLASKATTNPEENSYRGRGTSKVTTTLTKSLTKSGLYWDDNNIQEARKKLPEGERVTRSKLQVTEPSIDGRITPPRTRQSPPKSDTTTPTATKRPSVAFEISSTPTLTLRRSPRLKSKPEVTPLDTTVSDKEVLVDTTVVLDKNINIENIEADISDILKPNTSATETVASETTGGESQQNTATEEIVSGVRVSAKTVVTSTASVFTDTVVTTATQVRPSVVTVPTTSLGAIPKETRPEPETLASQPSTPKKSTSASNWGGSLSNWQPRNILGNSNTTGTTKDSGTSVYNPSILAAWTASTSTMATSESVRTFNSRWNSGKVYGLTKENYLQPFDDIKYRYNELSEFNSKDGRRALKQFTLSQLEDSAKQFNNILADINDLKVVCRQEFWQTPPTDYLVVGFKSRFKP